MYISKNKLYLYTNLLEMTIVTDHRTVKLLHFTAVQSTHTGVVSKNNVMKQEFILFIYKRTFI